MRSLGRGAEKQVPVRRVRVSGISRPEASDLGPLFSGFRFMSETGQPVNVVSCALYHRAASGRKQKPRENDRRSRDLEIELAHANRGRTMEAHASIAHEVNQPIAATVTNAAAALRLASGWIRPGEGAAVTH